MSDSGTRPLDTGSAGPRESSGGSLETASAALFSLGVLAGIVELFYRPFLFAPVGLVIVLSGALTGSKHRRLGFVAILVLALCFVIGAAIAVWRSRALY